MKNFKVIQYGFINKSFAKDKKYINWSRIFEWKYVLDHIKYSKPKNIHNTACGGLDINDCLHLTFCRDLNALVPNTVHSDVWGRDNYIGIKNKPKGDNFIFYDITKEHKNKYDLVLNISVIEHLPITQQINALYNLMNQVASLGELIVSFDYPDVDINNIKKVIGIEPSGYEQRLIGKNNRSVLLLHLKRLI